MSAPSTKIGTRASNAAKHPGLPDQGKIKRSPAEMAALRASKKAAEDAKAAADLAAPLVIARVEDSMAAVDMDNELNAARPAPANIQRVHHPLHKGGRASNVKGIGVCRLRVEGQFQCYTSVHS